MPPEVETTEAPSVMPDGHIVTMDTPPVAGTQMPPADGSTPLPPVAAPESTPEFAASSLRSRALEAHARIASIEEEAARVAAESRRVVYVEALRQALFNALGIEAAPEDAETVIDGLTFTVRDGKDGNPDGLLYLSQQGGRIQIAVANIEELGKVLADMPVSAETRSAPLDA